MIENHRYFKNPSAFTTRATEGKDETFSHLTNTHVLVDPSNFSSPPAEGWTEITKKQYETLCKIEQEASVAEEANAVSTANKERRLAFEEAVDLGFSHKAASAISGHVLGGEQ